MPLTAEQLELRKSGFGASEAAAACGLSKYEQIAELFLRKTGQVDDVDEMNRDILFGNCMEDGGMRYWSALRETPVEHPMPTVRHPTYPFMLSTPDGRIGPRRGLEFKTMGHFRFKLLEKHGITEVVPEYVLQVQQQMAVMDWDTVVIAILVGKDLHDIEVERNDRLINLIAEREALLWDHVQRREPPPIDFSREGCMRAVQTLYPEVRNDVVIRFSEDANAAWEAYENAAKQMKELKQAQEGYKAFCLEEVGENFGGVLTDGRMLRRKLVQRKAYHVEATEFWDFRAVKYDGSTIIEQTDLQSELSDVDGGDETDRDDVVRRIDFQLLQAGFIRHDISPSGSRYYVHSRGPERVRVSDHAPNAETQEWMDRADVFSIRIDESDAMACLKEICESVQTVAV